MSKLEVGYGHNTHAFLAECAKCGKKYHPDSNWFTAHTYSEERNTVVWMLYCRDCWDNWEGPAK